MPIKALHAFSLPIALRSLSRQGDFACKLSQCIGADMSAPSNRSLHSTAHASLSMVVRFGVTVGISCTAECKSCCNVHFSEPSLQHAKPSNEGQRSHKHGEQYHGYICSDAQCTSAPLLRVATCSTGTCVAAHGPQCTEGLAGQLIRIISLATLALLGGGALGMAGERGGMIMGGRGGGCRRERVPRNARCVLLL